MNRGAAMRERVDPEEGESEGQIAQEGVRSEPIEARPLNSLGRARANRPSLWLRGPSPSQFAA